MHLKSGTTRWVLLIGKYAFKFPRFSASYPRGSKLKIFLRGWLANIDEKWWSDHTLNKEKLCRVLFCFPGCLCIVMQRAENLSKEEYGLIEPGYFNGLPFDNKRENIGKLNGRYVLVDYADSRYNCSDCSFNLKSRS